MSANRTWGPYPSKSGGSPHTVTLADNSLLSCTCSGWKFAKGVRSRECTHITDVITKEGFGREIRGQYVFVSSGPTAGICSQCQAQYDKASGSCVNTVVRAGKLDACGGDIVDFDTFSLQGGPEDSIIVGVEDVVPADGATKQETTMTLTTVAAAEVAVMKACGFVSGRFGHVLDKEGFIIGDKFDAAFGTGEWIGEEKMDGHRDEIIKAGNDVFHTDQALDLPPHIVEAVRKLPFDDLVLDGELVYPGGVSTDVTTLKHRKHLKFIAFDILRFNGHSTTHLPLLGGESRRAMLEAIAVHFTPGALELVAQVEPTFALVQEIWDRKGEGLILKRKSSRYYEGDRNGNWIKVKALEQHVVEIYEFEEGLDGPCGITLFRFADGQTGRCRTGAGNLAIMRDVEANPQKYIGTKLVIQCQQRMRSGKTRHGIWKKVEWDHVACADEA